MLVDPQTIAQQAAANALALGNYQKVTVPYAQFQLARAQAQTKRNQLLALTARDRSRDSYFSKYAQAGLLNSGIANQAAERFTFDTEQEQLGMAEELAAKRQEILYQLMRDRIAIGQSAGGAELDLLGRSNSNYGKAIG
jgi:hypothetical protein